MEIENVIFKMVSAIRAFNNALIKQYGLHDIPYNVSGKAFPKIGIISLDESSVNYRFHGRGCTFWMDGHEFFFNVDTTSIHPIILTIGGVHCFLTPFSPEYNEKNYSDNLESFLEKLEDRGVFMTRKPTDLGTFHVNELWFDAYSNGKEFTGENKDDIDWI